MKSQVSFETHIDVFACILGNNKCIYFSTPMTNGHRLIKFRIQNNHLVLGTRDYLEQFTNEVLEPNCREGQIIAEELREQTGEFVIDPSCFDAKGWSQEDYLNFWCAVIHKYAKEVRFNDGWAFSNGCSREFLAARIAGIPTTNLSGENISVQQAIDAISLAIGELERVSIPTSALQATTTELSKLL